MMRIEQRTPRCARCTKEKPRRAFGTRRNGYLHSWCRTCHNAHARLMRAAARGRAAETSRFICGNS
jgi:hypothetical protein